MKRREFVKAGLIGAPLGLSWVLNTGCSTGRLAGSGSLIDREPAAAPKKIRIRHEASSPEAAKDLESYAKAVAIMMAQPATVNGGPNGLSWAEQAMVHQNHCPHGTWKFFPWHREYLFRFEEIIRKLSENPDFSLPYWDWATQPQLPAACKAKLSPLTLKDRSRKVNLAPQVLKIASPEICNTILNTSDFESFMGSEKASGELEYGPHNGIHVVVGSFGGPMGAFQSPLDPVFWMHHCNVDRLWAAWQEKNPQWRNARQIKDNSADWLELGLDGFYDTDGREIHKVRKASEVLDTYSFGYAYPETAQRKLAEVDTSPGTDRSPASKNWKLQVRAFTRDNIDAKLTFGRDPSVVDVAFPGFKGNVERYLDGAVADPTQFAEFVFRLKVMQFPKIPGSPIMAVNFVSADGREAFLANYNFFVPPNSHHHGDTINDFNFDYSRLLRRLHKGGLNAYPDDSFFRFRFFDPETGAPKRLDRHDFSAVKFKVVILEKVQN